MSREIPKVPTIFPSRSRSGSFVVDTHRASPSARVSFSSTFTSGCPVRMISCSSRSAFAACSSVKKSKSVRPTASAGLSTPKRAAAYRLMRVKRLCRSLK